MPKHVVVYVKRGTIKIVAGQNGDNIRKRILVIVQQDAEIQNYDYLFSCLLCVFWDLHFQSVMLGHYDVHTTVCSGFIVSIAWCVFRFRGKRQSSDMEVICKYCM
jgi:hypothetical protein